MKPRVPAYTREYEKEFFEKFYEERKRILDMGMAGHDMSDAFDSVRPKENGSAFETKFEVITNMGGKSWEEISHEQQKFFIITSKGRGYANKVVDEFLSTTSNVSEKKEIIRLRKKVEEDKWGFVVYNQKLGVYYSKSFHSRATTMDSDDFLQESMFGLEKAVSDFDKDRGLKFSTFAAWWVKQRVYRAINDKDKSIRFPIHVIEAARSMKPGTEEIRTLVLTLNKMVRIDAPIKNHENGDFAMDIPFHEEETMGEDEKLEVMKAVAALTPIESFVIQKRFGINQPDSMTLEEVGQEVGVTRERVRQIEVRAINRLRKFAKHLSL